MTGRSPEVDAWMAASAHPLKPVIEAVRKTVLDADKRVGECIKWKSPTFTYEGNIASINPNTKKKVSLMFHRGAEIDGDHPHLVGGGETVRYMYFETLADVRERKTALRAVIKAWCEQKCESRKR